MADPIRWQERWWHQQPNGSWLLFNEETQTWETYSGPMGSPVAAPSRGLSSGAKWAIGIAITAAVLVIVMILAAIAIPVFLRQREKGWISQVESALKNASTAEESYLTMNSEYTASVGDLQGEGLKVPSTVNLSIPRADGSESYCIEATHDNMPGDVWSLDSRDYIPREGPCI